MHRLCALSVGLLSWGAAGAAPNVQVLPEFTRTTPTSKLHGLPSVSWQDSLAVLGPIYPAAYGLAAFGDTDHDGFREIMMTVDFTDSFTVRTLEVQGNGSYTDVESFESFFYPYAIGDLDQDGKSEVVGQTSFSIEVFESQSATTHPTIPSWSSPPLSNTVGYSAIGDTDRDGRMEIIHSINPSRLIIFENKGDDMFEQKFFHQGPSQHHGRKVIADFDGDGLVEIAVSGSNGFLQVFESPADDVWTRTYLDGTGLIGAYGLGGGLDTDGNGLPELFLVGNRSQVSGGSLRNIRIYEAPNNDTYVHLATLTYDDQHMGGLEDAVAVTNIDGVGPPEAIFTFFRVILICRAVAPGQWILNVGAIDPDISGNHGYIYAHDVNLNGLPEVFWLAGTNISFLSLVLEHPGTLTTDTQSPAFALTRLEILPNPVRSQASISWNRSDARATRLLVLDVAGRLVRSQVLPHEAVRSFIWSSIPSRPGIYFLRAEDAAGRPLATGRAVVVR